MILKTPFRAPQADAFCERLIGSIRRERLDFLIPLNEKHLRRILKEWVAHYNRGRPHSSLGLKKRLDLAGASRLPSLTLVPQPRGRFPYVMSDLTALVFRS